MIKVLLRSLAIVLFYAIIFGIGLSFIWGVKGFFAGVFIASAVQFVGGYWHNIYLARKDRMFSDTLMSNLQETPVVIDLKCAYCNTVNHVPVSLSIDNVYSCKHCNQSNRLYIQLTSVRLTTPLTKNESLQPIEIAPETETIRESTINDPIQVA